MRILKDIGSTVLMLSIVVSLAVLVPGPAEAALLNPSSTGGSSYVIHNAHHHGTANATARKERLQAALTKFGMQGVDVSQPKADLSAGNTTAALQWLLTYRKDHPSLQGNRTAWMGGLWTSGYRTGINERSGGSQG